jgi:hypothetical protein
MARWTRTRSSSNEFSQGFDYGLLLHCSGGLRPSPLIPPALTERRYKKYENGAMTNRTWDFPSNLQLPDNTPAMASRRSFSKNGLLIMKSTPGSGLPEDFNISA